MREAGAADPLERMISTLRMGDGVDTGVANGIEAAVQRWRSLPRAQVAGRARSGRTTVAEALCVVTTVGVSLVTKALPEEYLDDIFGPEASPASG